RTRIEEGDIAQRVAGAVAHLGADLDKRAATDQQVVTVAWRDRLIFITADRAAAAGEEQLVGRRAVGAHDRAELAAQRADEIALGSEIGIDARFAADLAITDIGVARRDAGLDGHACADAVHGFEDVAHADIFRGGGAGEQVDVAPARAERTSL